MADNNRDLFPLSFFRFSIEDCHQSKRSSIKHSAVVFDKDALEMQQELKRMRRCSERVQNVRAGVGNEKWQNARHSPSPPRDSKAYNKDEKECKRTVREFRAQWQPAKRVDVMQEKWQHRKNKQHKNSAVNQVSSTEKQAACLQETTRQSIPKTEMKNLEEQSTSQQYSLESFDRQALRFWPAAGWK